MEDFLTVRLDDAEDYMRKGGYIGASYETFPHYDPDVEDDDAQA